MAKGKKPTPKEIYWERRHREEREKTALLPAGFVNHGNTCFMNSVLQGLVATHLLEDLILFQSSGSSQPSASRRSPLLINGRGSEDVQRDWVQGMGIGDAFVQIMERSWRIRDARERSSLSPRELLSRLGAKYDQYLDFRQQDAHEFLLHLLDGMRMEEFDIIKQRQPPPPPKPKSRSRAARITDPQPPPIPEEERLTSFVDLAFGGKLASVLICETCKNVSHTYEDFDDLSLSITHDEAKERMRFRLRTFASKLMSSSHRTRDQTTSRPLSFSQPPSPPLSATTLDLPEDAQEAPRRRSLEAPSSLDLTPETPRFDMFAGFGGSASVGVVGEIPIQEPKAQSRKLSEAGLGKLGRRISVGMALGGKKDKKSSKVERETTPGIPEDVNVSGRESGIEEEKIPISAPNSGPPSRQSSPKPAKKTHNEKSKRRKVSEHEVQKAVYLRRLLEDPTATPSNPLAVLRAASPMNPGSSPWSKMGSVRGIEDCLKMFTAVEVLDGENMFGCRNCWKIANGRRPERRDTQSDADSETSEEDEKRQQDDLPLRQTIVEPMHSFSMPNLPPDADIRPSNLSRSPTSTPLLASPNPTATVMKPNSPNLNLETTISTPSLSNVPHAQTSGVIRMSRPSTAEDASLSGSFTSEPKLHSLPIPTINAISPTDGYPSEFSSTSTPHAEATTAQQNRAHIVRFPGQLGGGYPASSRDSLRLPPAHTHHRREAAREGDSSLSSEESEYDTSGVSDGDGSVASVPNSNSAEPRRSSRPGIPRSKQVIYRRALKRYLIARPPPVLVIHLKRFQQVSKSPVTLFGNLKKLDEYVAFPEYLDIRRFLAPKKEDYGLGQGELRGKVVEKGKRAEDQPCVYRLYAVVVHIGNMLGGHYIAYTALPKAGSLTKPEGECDANGSAAVGPSLGNGEAAGSAAKNERQWSYISDTVVRLASLDEVLKSKAYICMYERLP